MLTDKNAVLQVFGDLLKNPQYLSETDKYTLTPSDFTSTFEKIIFSSIYNLYLGGAEKISRVEIDNYLKDFPPSYTVFEKEKGLEYLSDAEELAQPENFPYYYKRIKKFSCLRELKKAGYNVDKIYVENPIDLTARRANEKFDQLEVADIIALIRKDFLKIESDFGNNGENETQKASRGIENLLKDLAQAPDIGARLQGDYFNTITRGARKGKFYLRSSGSGVGKAIPNYTRIPTPNGWTTVGEVKVGDYLFDRFGKPTKVLGVYPQREKKQVYKVYFKSGKVAECCNEHLWSYYNNCDDRNPNKLLTSTLQEIIDNPKGLKNSKGAYRWSIPINQPVEYNTKQYFIDPYVMGLILGDGSFRYKNSQKGFFFSSADEELVQAIQERMHYKAYKKSSQYNYSWIFELTEEKTHKNVWVEDILFYYPELWQVKSENKFIPSDFLMGSIQQRYDLLAGLLDTDGSIDEKGRISFTTISPKMRNNVIELCESLGMICSFRIDKRISKYTTGECYNIHIQAPKENKSKMFKLKRKKEKAENYSNNGKRENRKDRDSIIKIEPTNNFTEMTCFYVDNPEHLFLINNFICSHNTRAAVGDACYIAYPIYYDTEKEKWVRHGDSEKVLFIATEQDHSEIQTLILAYLSGVDEEKIISSHCTQEEKERLRQAILVMQQYKDNLFIARVPNPNIEQIKAIVRQNYIVNNIQNVFYDYIFSSPSLLGEFRDLKIREDRPSVNVL